MDDEVLVSGFILLFARNGAPPDLPLAKRMLVRLAHRGPEGAALHRVGCVALGFQHFETTPQDRGVRQPYIEEDLAIVLDGRLDARQELIARLGLPVKAEETFPDVRLLALAYRRYGEGVAERLLGDYAFAIFDATRKGVLFGRDPLGNRTLFYTRSPHCFAAASEQQALFPLPFVSQDWNEGTIARFFALDGPRPGETFFSDIAELPAAHVMWVAGGEEVSRRYWHLPPAPTLRLPSDEAYAEAFLERLGESVRDRLRSLGRPAVLMSGGLDSTSVAAVAARMGREVVSISWVFEELTACDERPFIDLVNERTGNRPIQIPGDDAWPLRDADSWPWNPNTPIDGLYRRLRERVYRRLQAEGCRTLLTGEFGDNLFPGGIDWLADLVEEGRLLEALRSLLGEFRTRERKVPLGAALLRLAGALRNRLLRTDRVPGGIPDPPPPWLTPHAAALLAHPEDQGAALRGKRRPVQHESNLGPRATSAAAVETFHSSRFDLELRRPFRDPRLVAFLLDIPAHQLYRRGQTKYILRNAMRGILPEPVRCRRKKTSLFPLFRRGIMEEEIETLRRIVGDRNACWRRFVRSEWIEKDVWDLIRAGHDGPGIVVLWQCVCMERWRKGFSNDHPSCGGASK
ncbi:MAG: asparagine synthetase B [Deltaproteobacteria bacterium]|nr:MAG: asparagine synthetase B [Deltaproteobacteria bacterium]